MDFTKQYLEQVAQVAAEIDPSAINRLVDQLASLRERGGRLFLLGVGGSAANCSHAVNDFRKLAGIEAYAPTDNAAEITARTNDEGWESVFAAWLTTSKANDNDAVFVLSVGGGSVQRNVSVNLVQALDLAKKRGMTILGIVGRDGGYTKEVGDEVLLVPVVDTDLITPHTESFQSVILHGIISHPELLSQSFKWEGLK